MSRHASALPLSAPPSDSLALRPRLTPAVARLRSGGPATIVAADAPAACPETAALSRAGAASVDAAAPPLGARRRSAAAPSVRSARGTRSSSRRPAAHTAVRRDDRHAPIRSQADEWWRSAIGIDGLTPPGPGVPVTVVDSGLDLAHPEFARPRRHRGAQPAGAGAARRRARHDGLVARRRAGERRRHRRRLPAGAVLRSWDAAKGEGTRLESSEIVGGILAAARAGRGVINLSLGADASDLSIELAVERGGRARARSSSPRPGTTATGEARSATRRHYPHVLTVAATDRSGAVARLLEPVRLRGPGRPRRRHHVASALGQNWRASIGHELLLPASVAGAAAWIWTARPELTADQVAEVVRRSATRHRARRPRPASRLRDAERRRGARATRRRSATRSSRTTTSTTSTRRRPLLRKEPPLSTAIEALGHACRQDRPLRGPARRLPRLAPGRARASRRRSRRRATATSRCTRHRRTSVVGAVRASTAGSAVAATQAERRERLVYTNDGQAAAGRTSRSARGERSRRDLHARRRVGVRQEPLPIRSTTTAACSTGSGENDVRLPHAHPHAGDGKACEQRVGERGRERLEEVVRAAVRDLDDDRRRPRGSRSRPRCRRSRQLRPSRELELDVDEEPLPVAPLVLEHAVEPVELDPVELDPHARTVPRSTAAAARERLDVRAERRGRGRAWRRGRRRRRRPRPRPRRCRRAHRDRRATRASVLLRERPTSTGRPIATIRSSPRTSSRFWSGVLPKPMPGSRQTRSSGIPAATANASRSSRNAADLRDDVVVARRGLHRPRLSLHVHQAEVRAGVGDDAGELRVARAAP